MKNQHSVSLVTQKLSLVHKKENLYLQGYVFKVYKKDFSIKATIFVWKNLEFLLSTLLPNTHTTAGDLKS